MAQTPTLSNLRPPRGSRHRKVRVGRGMGSKMGKTSGAGNKGQQSRRGYSRRPGFEGGQMPLHRRLPKRGFSAPDSTTYAVINVESLNVFEAGETISPEILYALGVLRVKREGLKILGSGELKVALTVQAHAFSKSAEERSKSCNEQAVPGNSEYFQHAGFAQPRAVYSGHACGLSPGWAHSDAGNQYGAVAGYVPEGPGF